MKFTNEYKRNDTSIYTTAMRAFEEDTRSAHIFFDVKNISALQLGVNIFPCGDIDPFDYLQDNSLINEASLSAFKVLCDQIRMALTVCMPNSPIKAELSMRFSADKPYSLHHVTVRSLADSEGKTEFLIISICEYTEKEAFEKQVLSVFSSDKAPKFFGTRISRMLEKNKDKNVAFIQFDVEHFKLINDNYGVDTGDELLKFFSDSLAVICTDEQPFCRLTSDVFMIVTAFDEKEDLIDFIRSLEKRLCGFGYKDIDYKLVFGVAVVDDRSIHTRRMGDNATLARQSVKGNALNNIGFYDGSLKQELYHKQHIEDEMIGAMENHEFVMFLQPKHCISSGKIIGAEALARWIHPERGMISPAEFIPVFEKNGYIIKLDQYIWECACKKIRSWLDNGIEAVPISVNISREYLNSFDVVKSLSEMIKKYDIPINLLELEITESYDSECTSTVVGKLKAVGFTMLMDDFGSGYSSLNMLKTTQFDVLKIDREFLSEFMESERGRKIIAHTISMSQDIGLDIVAEGVETKEQANFLSQCGCDSAQGFYYSRPVPENEFDKKLFDVNCRI